MVAINSTGFDPELHITRDDGKAVAHLRSTNHPGKYLALTPQGLDWVKDYMSRRPLMHVWTLTELN